MARTNWRRDMRSIERRRDYLLVLVGEGAMIMIEMAVVMVVIAIIIVDARAGACWMG